jgi:hypothetical protein
MSVMGEQFDDLVSVFVQSLFSDQISTYFRSTWYLLENRIDIGPPTAFVREVESVFHPTRGRGRSEFVRQRNSARSHQFLQYFKTFTRRRQGYLK